ncbi:MAG: hypothetical protein OEM02_12855 [Desulfobulbaceae bacterium]|nr:hypothetical protein [Desulfobulbaceae bacterium]
MFGGSKHTEVALGDGTIDRLWDLVQYLPGQQAKIKENLEDLEAATNSPGAAVAFGMGADHKTIQNISAAENILLNTAVAMHSRASNPGVRITIEKPVSASKIKDQKLLPGNTMETKKISGPNKQEFAKYKKEEYTADYLREQGRVVKQNALERSGRGGDGGDRLVDGARTEFKRFQTANPDKVLRKIEKSLKGGGQAPNIVLDMRGKNMTYKEAVEVLNRLSGKPNAKRLDSIEIIGDNFYIRQRVKANQ